MLCAYGIFSGYSLPARNHPHSIQMAVPQHGQWSESERLAVQVPQFLDKTVDKGREKWYDIKNNEPHSVLLNGKLTWEFDASR